MNPEGKMSAWSSDRGRELACFLGHAITSPREERDLLICCASFILRSSAPLFPTLSLPAKSTRFSLPDEIIFERNISVFVISKGKQVGLKWG